MKRNRGNTALVVVRIKPELKAELDAYCEETDITIANLIRKLIEEEVKKRKGRQEE